MNDKTIVRFNDLTAPTRAVKKAYLAAIARMLDRAHFILTPEVEEFEKAWAAAVGVGFALGVSSGSDALYLALRALGVGEGDEVITQGNAYNASVTAIMRVGAVPRFADIDADTWTMNPGLAERLVTKKTKAIMLVHLFGQPNDMASLARIAHRRALRVVEDCAQSHGARFRGRMTGAWGDVGAFSFYPTKNLGAFGDAGGLTTSDRALYDNMKILRNLGQDGKDNHVEYGFNMRLDAMQAAALSLKLKRFGAGTRGRIGAARRYDRMIRDARIPLRPQARLAGADHVYHLYQVSTSAAPRDEIRRALKEQGIETGVYYPLPVYEQPFFRAMRLKRDPCPVSDRIVAGIFALPLYPDISASAQRRVIQALVKFFK